MSWPSLPTIVVGMRESPLETLQLLPAAGSVPWRVPKSWYFGVIVCSVGLHPHNIMTKTHHTTIYTMCMASAYHANPYDTTNCDLYCRNTFVAVIPCICPWHHHWPLFLSLCVYCFVLGFFPSWTDAVFGTSLQSQNTNNYTVRSK